MAYTHAPTPDERLRDRIISDIFHFSWPSHQHLTANQAFERFYDLHLQESFLDCVDAYIDQAEGVVW